MSTIEEEHWLGRDSLATQRDYWQRWLASTAWSSMETLTFRDRENGRKPSITATRAAMGWYGSEMEAVLGLKYFVVMEYGTLTGRLHLHCLQADGGSAWTGVAQENLRAKWQKKYGFTNTVAVSDNDKAIRYVVKYLLKGEDKDWYYLIRV